MKNLIVITGPTAVGKSSIGIELAKKIGGEIISADSMQVYKGMDIGTAKIKKNEMDGIPHFLIDEFEPTERFDVTVFQKRAKECIDDIKKRGKIPIIVGGTGFYIQSVLYDIDFKEYGDDSQIRGKYEELVKSIGKGGLHRILEEVDTDYAATVSENNVKKVIRAISFYESTGIRLSEHNKRERERPKSYDFSYFVLTMQREKLYEKINLRVDEMFTEGLVDEVISLLKKGYDRELVSMQGIGYKEVISYLNGEIDYDSCVNLIKKGTRNFAKRQLTWFRREREVVYIDRDILKTNEMVIQKMCEHIQTQN